MLPHHRLYGLAWTVAGLVWMLTAFLRLGLGARSAGNRWRALALLTGVLLGALAGARLHFVLLSPDLVRDGGLTALLLPLDEGAGLRIAGGLLMAGALVLGLGPLALGGTLSRAQICDALVPPAGIAIAVGRLGCLADGCCFGIPCTLPWCIRFPAASPASWSHLAQSLIPAATADRAAAVAVASLAVHPLQVYLAAAGLAAFAASSLAAARAPRPGTPALVFVLVVSLLRALLEPLRESAFGIGVAHQQALDLVCVATALATLLRGQRRTVGSLVS